MAEPPPVPVPPASGLRAVALWLATRLDDARFYKAAAYASMTADAIGDGSDEELQAETELSFELDALGQVWMVRQGDGQIVGR